MASRGYIRILADDDERLQILLPVRAGAGRPWWAVIRHADVASHGRDAAVFPEEPWCGNGARRGRVVARRGDFPHRAGEDACEPDAGFRLVGAHLRIHGAGYPPGFVREHSCEAPAAQEPIFLAIGVQRAALSGTHRGSVSRAAGRFHPDFLSADIRSRARDERGSCFVSHRDFERCLSVRQSFTGHFG